MNAEIRAALLAVVIAVHGLAAAPLPSQIREHERRSPDSLEEVRRWTNVFNAIGLSVSEEGLMDFSYNTGKFATQTRRTLLKPFQRIFRVTGTGQGWGLFTHPDRFPDHLEVYGKRDESWFPLYKAFDEEHDFLANQLAYRRVRGLWDGSANKPKPSFAYFVDWVAREAFLSDESLQQVRVQFRRSRTTTPREEPRDLNKVRNRRTRNRQDLLP